MERYYCVTIVKKFYSTLYWNGSKHCSACNVRYALCVFLTRSGISLQFYRRHTTQFTDERNERETIQTDWPWWNAVLWKCERYAAFTRGSFLLTPMVIILTRLRRTIFRVSCRVAESRGQISSAREAFNIAEFSRNTPLWKTKLGRSSRFVSVLGMRLIAMRQRKKGCSQLRNSRRKNVPFSRNDL